MHLLLNVFICYCMSLRSGFSAGRSSDWGILVEFFGSNGRSRR